MRAVVFDLDGTLIDSAPDLGAALNRLLASRGLPGLTAAAVQTMIGDGARVLVARAFAANKLVASDLDLADFLADYEANATVETTVYPGIAAALRRLQATGHKLAVCTNKPEKAARIILDALELQSFFVAVAGGDSTPFRKPDPRHLAAALTAMGAGEAVMIGDHENDMAAARGLGLPSIFAGWGYGAATGTHRAEKPEDVPGLVAGL